LGKGGLGWRQAKIADASQRLLRVLRIDQLAIV
jgi:hypothetical protein